MIVGFLLALLFEKEFPGRRVLLMLVLTPMMLSYVAIGAFFRYYYEPTFGLLSQAVRVFTGRPFILLDTPARALAGIIIADAWMWSPFVMLLVLSGLVSVPAYLYEAAEVDRASWRRRDRKSTRLNSSHANISYAVFCLKKKKKKTEHKHTSRQ